MLEAIYYILYYLCYMYYRFLLKYDNKYINVSLASLLLDKREIFSLTYRIGVCIGNCPVNVNV